MIKEVAIKDICNKDSSALKQKELLPEGKYPVYGASGIAGYLDSYQQENEYIGIVKDGSGIGRVAFYPEKSSLIGTMQYILPKKGYNIRYIGYCLQSLDLSKYKQGAAIPHIYFSDYGVRRVKITSDELEQDAIVERLDAAFARIDALKANAEQQINEVRSLFQRALTEEMKPQTGWQQKTLKEITTKIGSGATPEGGKKVYLNNGIALVRSLNVHNAEFKYKDLAHINQAAANQLNSVELQKNDVLFNITGASIARCCVLPDDILPGRVNQHVSILRPKTDMIVPQFLCMGLLSSYHQKELLSIGMAGSTRQALTKADLEKHVFPIPSIREQQRIILRLGELTERVRKLENNYWKTVSESNALKQAMLREVFE